MMSEGAAGTPEEPADSLWRFALAVYAAPGIQPLCLDLQDRGGVDVPVLLFALWAGAVCGAPLAPPEWSRLAGLAAHWHGTVVAPLRAVRRHLKAEAGAEAFRERIKTAELEAERMELDRLCRTSGLRPGTGDRAAAAANLRQVIPDGFADDAIPRLLDAVPAAEPGLRPAP